ncbi:MAG: MFS family permease [Paracoccaceae bacterium]|jgi:MFS family permease
MMLLVGFAVQIQTVTISWHVYQLTHNPMDLGLIGLSQFMPALVLILFTGSITDQFSRKLILRLCLVTKVLVALSLTWMVNSKVKDVRFFYMALVVFGVSRAFFNPARQAIVANLVSPELLPRALTTIITANKLASICGPIFGGVLYAVYPEMAVVSVVIGLLIAFTYAGFVPLHRQVLQKGHVTWKNLVRDFLIFGDKKLYLAPLR